ncbi:MAG: hypothetical protein ACPHAS_08130, partial [Synechococcus sp.]
MSSPVLVFAALVMLAPSVPTSSERQELRSASRSSTAANTTSFQYIPDDEVYALELDPRKVRFGLLEGWDREQDAFED